MKVKLQLVLDQLNEGLSIQEASTEMMTFLVQDLLDFAQIKANKFRKNISKFDIESSIEKLMKMHLLRAQQSKVKLHYQFVNFGPRREDRMISTDEQRVMQVTHNFVSNALKFTKEGEVAILVELVNDRGLRYLKISVSDTGIGIKDEDRHKLFKLFGFLHSTQGMNTKGIGLGLAICKMIVLQFRGDIYVDSKCNHGSVFTFTFELDETSELQERIELASEEFLVNNQQLYFEWSSPLRDLSQIRYVEVLHDSRNDQELAIDEAQGASPATATHILIADDQIFNIQALKIQLKVLKLKSNVHIHQAFNGHEAVELISNDLEANHGRSCSFSFILMDCNMPFMDGYEASNEIRTLIDSYNLPQPIISAVTGHTEQNYINKAIACGMNQVLSKPVESRILKATLAKLGLI